MQYPEAPTASYVPYGTLTASQEGGEILDAVPILIPRIVRSPAPMSLAKLAVHCAVRAPLHIYALRPNLLTSVDAWPFVWAAQQSGGLVWLRKLQDMTEECTMEFSEFSTLYLRLIKSRP